LQKMGLIFVQELRLHYSKYPFATCIHSKLTHTSPSHTGNRKLLSEIPATTFECNLGNSLSVWQVKKRRIIVFSALLVALFALIFGLAFCFGGYRVFLVMLPIWGFFAGFWLGAEATTLIFGAGFLATTTGWIVGFVVGLLGAVLSYMFYMLGIALVAAGFGWALGSGLMVAAGFSPGFITAIVGLVMGLVMVGLVVGLNLQKYVIIAITAIGGANALLLSVMLVLGRVSLDSLRTAGNAIAPILQDSWFWLIVWLVLAIAGFAVQVRSNRDYTFSRDQVAQDWG
jgi:hypothetical protein